MVLGEGELASVAVPSTYFKALAIRLKLNVLLFL
jgi:hypothetical protein